MAYLKWRGLIPYVYRSVRYGEDVVSTYQMRYDAWLKLGYGLVSTRPYSLMKARRLVLVELEHGHTFPAEPLVWTTPKCPLLGSSKVAFRGSDQTRYQK